MALSSSRKKQGKGGRKRSRFGDEEEDERPSSLSSSPLPAPREESLRSETSSLHNDMHIEKKKKILLEEKEAEQASQALLEKWNRQSSIGSYRPGVSLFLRRLSRLADSVRTPGLPCVQTGSHHSHHGGMSSSSVDNASSSSVKPPASTAATTDEIKAITSFTLWLRQALIEAPDEDVPSSKAISWIPKSRCRKESHLGANEKQEEEEGENSCQQVKKGKNSQSMKKKKKIVKGTLDQPREEKEKDHDAEGEEGGLVSGFRFQAPRNIQVVGSLPLGLLSNFDKNVDIAVEMPAHMFQFKDHLNYRYLTKRFEYLRRLFSHLQATFSSGNSPSSPSDKDRKTSCSSSIAADQGGKKKKSKKGSSVEWNNSHSNSLTNEAQNIFRSLVPQWSPQVSLQYWQSDAVKPIIVITFTTSSSLRLVNGSSVLKSSSTSETICGETDLSQWIVRIFPVPPSSPESHSLDSQGHSSLPLFRESLLGPERNCVRRPSFLSWKEEEDEEEDVTQSGSIKKRRNEEEEQSLRHVLKGDLSKGPRKGGGDEHHEVTLLRPTPYYNGLLLEDIFMKKHSSLLQKCCAMFGETFRITVHLLKIWALRRSPGLLTLSQNEKAMRLSMASSPTKEAARSRMSSIPATGVNGFTLAMMCGHACLSGGLDESSSINPRQLLSLTFSFLSRADFLNYFYIFGDPQPHSRDTLLLRNKPNMTGRAAGTDSLEEGWAVGQQPGLSSVSKKASKAGGQVQPANKNHANQDEANQRKSLLAAGLISEAFLFDSPSCSCNLLFRSQLHIPELQAMARESLHALEKLEDPFDFLFGGLPKLLNAEGAYRCSGKKGQMPVPASLLLANDVQVYIPQISSTLLKRAMRPFMTEGFPAIADYVPSVEGGQGSHSDERASERGVARATQGENRNEVQQNDFSTLDEGVKWEASPARLFAEALVRFCVRALGDRLDLVQVRFVHPTYSGLTAELHPLLSANVKELSKEESFLEKEDSALANLPLAFPSYEALSAACDIPVGVLLSLRLRGEAISRALDRGPPATGVSSSDEAIQSFKSFWGTDIVELRRFQDGQILHTVLWQKDECCGRESNGRIADIPSNSRKCLPLLPPISCVCGKVHAPPHTQILSHLFHRHWSRVLALRGQEWVSTVKEAEGEQSLHEVAPTHTGGEGRKPGDPLTTDVKRADCWMQGTILGGTASSAGAAQKQMRKQLMQAYAELRNTIHSLSGLPVTVKQVRYADPASLYVDVFATPRNTSRSAVEDARQERRRTYPVVIEFEDSPAWPEDLTAMKKLKTAFLVEMQKELFDDYSIAGSVTEDHLDVEIGDICFRIRILQPLEVAKAATLYGDPNCDALSLHLKKLPDCLVKTWNSLEASVTAAENGGVQTPAWQSSKELDSYPSHTQDPASLTQEAFSCPAAEDVLSTSSFFLPKDGQIASKVSEETKKLRDLRDLWWAPQITASLQTCAMRFPAFTGSLAIICRWLGEMQLPGLLRLAEHVTTALFVDHLRQGFGMPPQSPHVAFLRFLQVVANFPWAVKPFCVSLDPDQPLTPERERQLEASYDRFNFYPSVRTIFDPHGVILPVPDSPTVNRFIRTARSALCRVATVSFAPSSTLSEWSDIFTFDWRCFDVVVLLRDPLGRGGSEGKRSALRRQYVNMDWCDDPALDLLAASDERHAVSMRRYLFVRFLQKLRDTYPGALVIGFNCVDASLGGCGIPSAVGLKLKLPLLSQQCSSGTCHLESSSASRFLVNPVLLFASVLSMGSGLVESIHLVA